jgi:transcription elongation GreA/GreB family factor
MSRAFVSEEAAEANTAVLLERPVSPAPNLVTVRGLELIDTEVARLEKLLGEMAADNPERARIGWDLRYWRARRASAQVVTRPAGTPDEVAFGTKVTICRGGGAVSYRIVGEDEADPPNGLLSWTSPLAKSLMGARAGDVVEIGGGRPAVMVDSIESA